MAKNIEIKARAPRFDALRAAAEREATELPVLLVQEDIFYDTPQGRLKLRLEDGRGHLIAYRRPDQDGPKTSTYEIYTTHEPDRLRTTLDFGLPVAGVVRKRRTLIMIGQTRVHLDEVEGLGQFVELEVVLRPRQSGAEGGEEASRLMALLDIRDEELIDGAYFDLLSANDLGKTKRS